MEKVLQYIRLESNMRIPPNYLNALRKAELPFLHQRVFDPRTQTLVHLTPIPEGIPWDEEMDAYVGLSVRLLPFPAFVPSCCFFFTCYERNMEVDIARGIAEGNFDPTTLLPVVDINPGFKPRSSSKVTMYPNPMADHLG